MKKIPVVIPYYKNKKQLDRCVQHLSKQTVSVELFIRDNSEDNIHFTAAINEGLRHFLKTDCEAILILNQDFYLQEAALEAMLQVLADQPQCGIVAPLQVHQYNEKHVICAGSFAAFPFGKHEGGPLAEFTHDRQILWANGACMLLRRAMLEEVGLLDKNMVFVCSDADICFSARARGWEVWSAHKSIGVHEGGESSESTSRGSSIIKLRDTLYFGRKWVNGELYRSMAYEGPELTPDKAEHIMQNLRVSIEKASVW